MTEANGRRLGKDADMCRVAIDQVDYGLSQTVWLNVIIHHGPHQRGLETDSWYRSYEKFGAELGRFVNRHACPKFLKALRKELGDG